MSFVNAIHTTAKSTKTFTENGMPTRTSSTNYCVDYFYNVGTLRKFDESKHIEVFTKAYSENPDLATRILLYSRDIRGGMGERKHFRIILTYLSIANFNLAERLMERVSELGRWDDLLVTFSLPTELKAKQLISAALTSGNSLCAKWMPRESSSKRDIAYKLRKHMNLTPKQYRKLLSSLTQVVETPMCANAWPTINYSHVPSQASRIYRKAFGRHDFDRYNQFLNDAVTGTNGAKVNASATFPYEIINSSILNASNLDTKQILAQWQNLPNYLPTNSRILPMIDVSGSMNVSAAGSKITCMDAAVSLGLYVADKQSGPFKDVFCTFHTEPSLIHATGDIVQKARQTYRASWGGSTDFERAIEAIFALGAANNVAPEDMPEYLLVFSDMQFNAADRNFSNKKLVSKIAKEHGYKAPKIVFWNLRLTETVPSKSTTSNVALVSGFSPALVKSVLSDVESYTPENVMLNAITNPRYNY